jgi:hypothetical protein
MPEKDADLNLKDNCESTNAKTILKKRDSSESNFLFFFKLFKTAVLGIIPVTVLYSMRVEVERREILNV